MTLASKCSDTNRFRFKALYEAVKHNAPLYERSVNHMDSYQLRILEHNIFYGAISEIKINTGLISDNAASLSDKSEKELTEDHIFSPQRFASYFFKNILGMTFEEFLENVIPICYVIKVTKKENNDLLNLEKANKKENKFVLDKYEQMGITIWGGYDKYDRIPDYILDTIPTVFKEMSYDYDI